MAELRNVTEKQAAAEVHRLDAEREAFHRRFASAGIRMEDTFTISLNTAMAEQEALVDCVLPLVGHTAATSVDAYRRPEAAHVCSA
jgi:hypothetical protein